MLNRNAGQNSRHNQDMDRGKSLEALDRLNEAKLILRFLATVEPGEGVSDEAWDGLALILDHVERLVSQPGPGGD